jgi:hypothetical protein
VARPRLRGRWGDTRRERNRILQLKREIVSLGRIRLDSWKSVRTFKGIFFSDISKFESNDPSQPVRLQRDTYEDRSKTARHREVSQICLGLRVRNSAMEASCRPPVSEDHFWCLVFTERPLPHIHDPDRFLLNWRRGAETAPPGSGSNSRVARFASATEPPSVARYREVLLCGATSGHGPATPLARMAW